MTNRLQALSQEQGQSPWLDNLKRSYLTSGELARIRDRGVRNAGWESNSNIRIEVICTAAVASAISLHLQDNYYANYAMVVYSSDVSVLRPDKF